MEHASDLTTEERLDMRRKIRSEIRDVNPGVSREELQSILREAMLETALEARKRKSQSAKDYSLSLLPLGTAKKAASLSSCAEPRLNAPLHWKNSLSLTVEERVIVYAETKAAIPNADEKAFSLKYKVALWEADVKKNGGKSGVNLGNVDLSSLSETDDEEDSGENSNPSEDGGKAIADDLLKQRQVSPPSSPKENRYLVGLMKSSENSRRILS